MVLRGRSGVMIAVLLVLAGGLYGVLVEREHLFPFDLLRPAPPAWSIGIYEGPSPFVLGQPPHLTNPVLTRNDVTDLKAEAVADPFVVVKDSTFFMFFEVVEAESRQGAIAPGHELERDGLAIRPRGHRRGLPPLLPVCV